MADYKPDQKEFYDECKEDGGSITILVPVRADLDPGDVDSTIVDKSLWTGNDVEPGEVPYYALWDFVDQMATDNSRFLGKVYVPNYNLSVTLTNEMTIVDASGKAWSIDKITPFTPDGLTVIFNMCEVHRWPQS